MTSGRFIEILQKGNGVASAMRKRRSRHSISDSNRKSENVQILPLCDLSLNILGSFSFLHRGYCVNFDINFSYAHLSLFSILQGSSSYPYRSSAWLRSAAESGSLSSAKHSGPRKAAFISSRPSSSSSSQPPPLAR